jgi:hypothetical protein
MQLIEWKRAFNHKAHEEREEIGLMPELNGPTYAPFALFAVNHSHAPR